MPIHAFARCLSKTALAGALAAALCPLACQAQGVWYGAGGIRTQVAAAGAGPVEREIAFGSDVSVRTRVLTRTPGSGSGPAAANGGQQKFERIEFLADYKLRGSVRLSGGLSIAGSSLGSPDYQEIGRSVAALSALRPAAGDSLFPYLGVGFRQTDPGDRGWDVYGDLGLSLEKRDESGTRAISRNASLDGGREPVAVNSSSLMPQRADRSADTGLRVGPRLSLGANYRY